MYEHKRHPIISRREFAKRVALHAGVAAVAVAVALGVGVCGYHFVGHLAWLDSLLNASMILGGMGPVDTLRSPAAKLFASLYALFSGLFFIGVATVLMSPFVHRFLHKLHAAESKA